MSTVQVDTTTSGLATHVVSSTISGHATIEVWGSGGYSSSYSGYSSYPGAGGNYSKSEFTIAGDTYLQLVVPGSGDVGSVYDYDEDNPAINSNVVRVDVPTGQKGDQSAPGTNVSPAFNFGGSGLVALSTVTHIGGDGENAAGGGGGGSAGPSSDGNPGASTLGGAAVTEGGRGGNGQTSGSGETGQVPGGGAGGTTDTTGGPESIASGGVGRVRISYDVAVAPTFKPWILDEVME